MIKIETKWNIESEVIDNHLYPIIGISFCFLDRYFFSIGFFNWDDIGNDMYDIFYILFLDPDYFFLFRLFGFFIYLGD